MENISIPYKGSEVPKIAVCGYPVDIEALESVWIVAGLAATAAIAAVQERFRRYRRARAHHCGEHEISLQWAVSTSNFRMWSPCICWTMKKTDAVSGWESLRQISFQTKNNYAVDHWYWTATAGSEWSSEIRKYKNVNHDNQIQYSLHHYSDDIDWRAYTSVGTSRELSGIPYRKTRVGRIVPTSTNRIGTIQAAVQQPTSTTTCSIRSRRRGRGRWLCPLSIRLQPSWSVPRHVERRISYSDWSIRVRHDTTFTRQDYLLLLLLWVPAAVSQLSPNRIPPRTSGDWKICYSS